MQINKELIEYVNSKIKPLYLSNNYGGHDWKHILDVTKRSFELIKEFKLVVDPNMVYIIAVYHDIGYYKDADNHEQVSSDMLLADAELKRFFNDEEIRIMAEAVYDHRASLEYEARSVYGKLVSSADRAIDVDVMLERSIAYQSEKHKDENPSIEDVIEYSYKKLNSKYGNGGYAKMYFPDDKYQNYLARMNELLLDKSKFIEAEMAIISEHPELLKGTNVVLRKIKESN